MSVDLKILIQRIEKVLGVVLRGREAMFKS